ncbi:polysaccharide deacetylase family protein [Candidatus Woesearchaeota archaeon]|nr:polysaccharide deacetylase family protein [Candidatus Woesearchaeota archaeon]
MVRHHFRFGSCKRKLLAFTVIAVFFALLFVFLFSMQRPRYALLSFDVEPVDGRESVMGIIDFIVAKNEKRAADEKVNVTFFVTGEYALKNRDVIARMTSEGFEIACHSFSHPLFLKLNESQKRNEVFRCKRALDIAQAPKPQGFRAPYMLIDRETMRILERNHVAYDASTLSYTEAFYGHERETQRIPVSAVGFVPLHDIIWVDYLRIPSLFYWFLRHVTEEAVSVVLHPRYAISYLNELESVIDSLSKRNVSFISYYHFTEVTHERGKGLDGS